jgi:hypothetical protein
MEGLPRYCMHHIAFVQSRRGVDFLVCSVRSEVLQHVLSFLQGSPRDLLTASHVSLGLRGQCLDELFYKVPLPSPIFACSALHEA